MFRGGSGGGARATSRQRAETELLDGLRGLLDRFAAPASSERPAKKAKTNTSHKDDGGLLQALQQLVLQAQASPRNLLQDLQNLVQEYSLKAEGNTSVKRPRWADQQDSPSEQKGIAPGLSKSKGKGAGKQEQGKGAQEQGKGPRAAAKGLPGTGEAFPPPGQTKGAKGKPEATGKPASWASVVASAKPPAKSTNPTPDKLPSQDSVQVLKQAYHFCA